jgi:hypothetical protein
VTQALIALCVALWAAIAPGLERAGDAAAIANASARAVMADAAGTPALSSHAEDLAALAYQAYREASLRVDAVGDRGKARGPWQLHGACNRLSLDEQARCELRMLHDGAAQCPEHPLALLWGACHAPDPLTGRYVAGLAAARERRVRALLGAVLAEHPP